MRRTMLATGAAAVLTIALWGPAREPARAEVPTDPPTFTNPLVIDNPYHPFVPYRIRVYEETKEGDANVLDVFLPETRTFLLADGTEVTCATIQEWEIEEGELREISWNWFAQADDGTVYYFGEVVDNYEGGVVDNHEGSWLVGGPGAGDPAETATADAPAVFMPGNPEVGDTWKPEDIPELDIEEFVTAKKFLDAFEVPAGTYFDVLKVKEKTPDTETKWYASGVGFIQGKEGSDREALVALIDNEDEQAMQDALEAILDELLE